MSTIPFLKWAGGKRWLATSRPEWFPKVTGRHIEPFVGSAAVFFATQPKSAILSDTNSRLIECYSVIKRKPDEFSAEFSKLARSHSKEFYYQTRAKKFRSEVRRAAQFLYLNRVCFNGIYRENLRGEFNVPIGSKSSAALSTDDFQATSQALENAELRVSDFEPVIDNAMEGDFLFVDPPYTTKHNLNGFVKYNQKIFSWDDQIRLAGAVCSAVERGVSVLVSNADHQDVRELYKEFIPVKSIGRASVIASSATNRGKTTEMVAGNVI